MSKGCFHFPDQRSSVYNCIRPKSGDGAFSNCFLYLLFPSVVQTNSDYSVWYYPSIKREQNPSRFWLGVGGRKLFGEIKKKEIERSLCLPPPSEELLGHSLPHKCSNTRNFL